MQSCFKGKFRVTSPYGMRNGTMHNGIDLVGDTDINVYAPCDGTIGLSKIVDKATDTGRTWEWGEFVRIDTVDKQYSIFLCHMSKRFVFKGQKVKKGDKVGMMGCTGFCIPSGVLGTHTHYEVRKYGTYTRVNPADFIGIPNRVGTYEAVEKRMLESGNDIVWQLMNGNPKIVINEPKRAIEALDKAKDNSEYMSLYWIIYKIVNGETT